MDFRQHVLELKKLKPSNKFKVNTIDGQEFEVEVPRLKTSHIIDLYGIMAQIDMTKQQSVFAKMLILLIMGWENDEIDALSPESFTGLFSFIVETEKDFFGQPLVNPGVEVSDSTS